MRPRREVTLLRAGPWIVIVDIVVHGDDARPGLSRVLGVLAEVYAAAGPPPSPVEVHAYPSQAALELGVKKAAAEAGAAAAAAFEAAAFEALTGLPRLHVCTPCIEAAPWSRALLAHEAGHTILHAGLEYYTLRLPAGVSVEAAYAAAAAVKDLEANLLLARSGLAWALEGLRRYWAGLLASLNCRKPEWLLDTSRAATAWLVEGMHPPLPPCPGADEAIAALERAMHAHPRPWAVVEEVAAAFNRLLGTRPAKG